MKILVTSCPTYGHFFPLVPLCWALRSAGHEVMAALPGRFTSIAESAGIMSFQVSSDDHFYNRTRTESAHLAPKWGEHTDDTHHGRVVQAVIEHVLDTYVPISYSTADAMVELAEKWQPDLVLQTPWEYSGQLIATMRGIPRVTHGWGVALPPELETAEAQAIAPLLNKWGIRSGVQAAKCHIDICPPSLQYENGPLGAQHMRYVPFNGSAQVEPWLLEKPSRKRVCVSIGSVPIENGHAHLLESVVIALSRMDVEAIVLTGGVQVKLEHLPGNIRLISNNIPLSYVLPSCDFVVHHGGSGSTMTSSTLGLPQLAIPQMCDQFRHAERIAESKVGITLTDKTPHPDDVYDAIQKLLNDPTYRNNAQKMRAENLQQRTPQQFVELLEQLVLA